MVVHSSIDQHPDLLALRRFDRAAESTIPFGLACCGRMYDIAVDRQASATLGLPTCDYRRIAVAYLAYGFASALDHTA